MQIHYFAGPVFTTRDVVIFCLIALAILFIICVSIFYIVKALIHGARHRQVKKKADTARLVLIGLGLLSTMVLLGMALGWKP